jgi:hypothetical protein
MAAKRMSVPSEQVVSKLGRLVGPRRKVSELAFDGSDEAGNNDRVSLSFLRPRHNLVVVKSLCGRR